MPILPFTTIEGKQFPLPRTIILAAIAQLRHSEATDFEIACFACECLAAIVKENDFEIVSVKNPYMDASTGFWTLHFNKRENK